MFYSNSTRIKEMIRIFFETEESWKVVLGIITRKKITKTFKKKENVF